MRNADYHDKRSLTETITGIGFAELWLALEWIVRKAVRSLHLLPNHRVREHQQGEISHHGNCRDKNPSWGIGQCEGSVEWKTHRESAAPIRGC